MLKRELKITRKSLFIWLFVLISIFTLVFAMYPYIMNETSGVSMDELLSMFPEEVLKAFNMDIADISTALGWLKTEGITFLLLIYGLYASILGSNIILKEESDKTIEFLYSKPISRNKILTTKIVAGIINIFVLMLFNTIFINIGLLICDCYDFKEINLLCLVPLLPTLVIFFISLCISTFFKKTKQTIGISIALVFINYFIYTFASISSKIENLKYITVYTLADIRNVINNLNFNIMNIPISIVLIMILLFISYKKYNQKEFL